MYCKDNFASTAGYNKQMTKPLGLGLHLVMDSVDCVVVLVGVRVVFFGVAFFGLAVDGTVGGSVLPSSRSEITTFIMLNQ